MSSESRQPSNLDRADRTVPTDRDRLGSCEAAPWARMIVHADMDAFYAAVEQLDRPELRGKPVLVGGPGNRGVVTTASYEARPFKVGSAMPMAVARRRCPDAIVVPPRFSRYKEISQQIMTVFRDFSPDVEPLSLDEAFLDMSGSAHLFGPPHTMGRAIKAAVFKATGGLTVSVGVANTKYVAKVASDIQKPDGLTVVPPEAVLNFLHPLPITWLWGVGPKSAPRFVALGLHTIGDVAKRDPAWLRAQLGSLGAHAWRLAHNHDNRQIVTRRRAKSVGCERTLAQDVRGLEQIRPHLLAAADQVAKRLRKKGIRALGVRVKLKTRHFESYTRQTVLSRPADDPQTFFAVAWELLARFDLRKPMRLVGLAAFDLISAGEPYQGELFNDDSARRIAIATDLAEARFGRDTVERASRLGQDHPWRRDGAVD